jgi:hypothetical protein
VPTFYRVGDGGHACALPTLHKIPDFPFQTEMANSIRRRPCLSLAPHFSCHTPRMRGIQYAAASRLYHQRLWNTGSPGQAGRRRLDTAPRSRELAPCPLFSLSARCPSASSHRERQQRVGTEFLTSDKPLLRNRRRAVRDLVRHRLDLGDHKFGRRVLHHVTDARQHDQPCVRHRGGERAGMNIGRHGFVDVA